MKPIRIQSKIAGGNEQQIKNIVSAMKRTKREGLKEYQPDKKALTDLDCYLIGSGPTIRETIPEVIEVAKRKPRGMIVAINAAHDYLVEHGVIPDLLVAVDPRARIWKGFQKRQKETLYLIASQCHPFVFNHLKGYRVMIWHSMCSISQRVLTDPKMVAEFGDGHWHIHGGTTATTRAMTIAYGMGFRKFHLYGVDSSMTTSLRNIDGIAPEKGKCNYVEICGETFLTDPQMMSQATELTRIFDMLPGIKVTSHGKNLTTALLTEAAKYRGDCYGTTQDLSGLRSATALGVFGSGTVIDDALLGTGGDHPAHPETTPLHAHGTH